MKIHDIELETISPGVYELGFGSIPTVQIRAAVLPEPAGPDLPGGWRLSPHTHCRREGEFLLVDCPVNAVQMVTRGPQLLALLFGEPEINPEDLAPGPDSKSADGDRYDALRLLYFLGMLVSSERPQSGGVGVAGLSQWSFHDIVFHTRTRFGRYADHYGAKKTDPGGGSTKPADPSPPPEHLSEIELPAAGLAPNMPLHSAIAVRRSSRQFSDTPLEIPALGDFLFHSLAVRHGEKVHPSFSVERRPYPSGGAIYPLRCYLTVWSCGGLEKGLYYYCPSDHRLYMMRGWGEDLELSLNHARTAMRQENQPPMLITMTAEFGRIFGRYATIGYSLLLKELGTIFQSFYLVAADLGVAGCAIGGGDSDLFARCSGLDYFAEGAIGEFAIGRPKEPVKPPTEGPREE